MEGNCSLVRKQPHLHPKVIHEELTSFNFVEFSFVTFKFLNYLFNEVFPDTFLSKLNIHFLHYDHLASVTLEEWELVLVVSSMTQEHAIHTQVLSNSSIQGLNSRKRKTKTPN